MDLKFLLILVGSSFFWSCTSSYSISKSAVDSHISQWEITPQKKTQKILLFLGHGINSPDSIPTSIVNLFIESGYKIIGVEKYDTQQGYTRVINTDTKNLRIQTVSDFLQSKTYSQLIVYGEGEGGLIAPQIAENNNADALILNQAILVSSKEFYENVMISKGPYKDSISNSMDLTTDEKWMAFIEAVTLKPNTGNAWNGRSSRQYASYWEYVPMDFLLAFKGTSLVISNVNSPVYKKEYDELANRPSIQLKSIGSKENAIRDFLESVSENP